MQTLVGYSESIDAATLTQIAALSDQHITTQNDDILVPEFASRIGAVLAIGVNLTEAQVSAPSLRERSLLDIRPINVGAEPLGGNVLYDTFDRPVQLEAGEGLRALVAEDAAGAARESVLIWLMGEDTPTPDGEIETIKCTSATTLNAYAWTLCELTLTQQLRAGTYAVVGMRAESAGAIAARLVLPGSAYRPGVIAYDAGSDVEIEKFRMGNNGSLGEFSHQFIPAAEFFAASADTSEVVYLDVIKIA
jgi:hypothetical protein